MRLRRRQASQWRIVTSSQEQTPAESSVERVRFVWGEALLGTSLAGARLSQGMWVNSDRAVRGLKGHVLRGNSTSHTFSLNIPREQITKGLRRFIWSIFRQFLGLRVTLSWWTLIKVHVLFSYKEHPAADFMLALSYGFFPRQLLQSMSNSI